MSRSVNKRESIIENQYFFFHFLTLEPVKLYLFSCLPSVITLAMDMICIDAVITHEHILLENQSYIESRTIVLKRKWLKKFPPGLRNYMSSCSLK